MGNEQITRQQSQAMRGIAILAIVLHNYSHWLGQMVQENEYQFHEHNVRRIMVELAHPSWELIVHLLSFLGHYGVPVFVFLSAYGLVKKYEGMALPEPTATNNSKWWMDAWEFICRHYKKLFMMMIVGYAAFVMVDYMTPGPRHYEFWNVIGQLGMFSNFYADPDHDIWPGPYWYFGLMVQIYVVYRLVLYPGKGSLTYWIKTRQDRWKTRFMPASDWLIWGLFFVTLVAQLFFNPEGMALQWYRYNIFGSLPVFIAGMMFARHPGFKEPMRSTYGMLIILCAVFVFLLSLWFTTWILVPFVICVGVIAIVKILPQSVMAPLVWIGGLSASMFVCHPIARKVLIPISRHGDVFAGLILYIVVTIILAILFKKIIAVVSSSYK